MTDGRNTADWPWMLTAFAALALFYVLSFGPACWLVSHLRAGQTVVSTVYRPVTWGLSPTRDTQLDGIIRDYASIGSDGNLAWIYYDDRWILDLYFRPPPGMLTK